MVSRTPNWNGRWLTGSVSGTSSASPNQYPLTHRCGSSENASPRRAGSWTKKGDKSSFRYKLHAKMDTDLDLVRDLEVSTASLHDSRIDLSEPSEVVYRDKGYFGAVPRGYDATMKRATRGHPLGIRDRLRNTRINRKRAPGEGPFTVIKRVFHAGYVMVTTVPRFHVKLMFACFCFNLVQLDRL